MRKPPGISLRTALAVLVAGVTGMLAYGLAGALFVDAGLLQLLARPGFYLVGVFFLLPLPLLYRYLPGVKGAGLALLLLTVVPAYVSKQSGDTALSWPVLLGLTFTYALAALAVYRLVAGGPR